MEVVKLTPDQKSASLKAIQDMWDALRAMFDWVKEDTLYPDMLEAVPHNLEYYLADLCRSVGYDSDIEKKIQERHKDLKKANMRIYELEKQMGEQGDINIVPQVMKVLKDRVYNFWKAEGFGHVSELIFTDYGYCKIKFSGMLFPNRGMGTPSDTPETDKITADEWIQRLKDKGFILMKESKDSRREEHVIDNDHNRALIIKTITDRFPTAKVFGFENYLAYRKHDIFHIRDISVMVYDLAEI